MTSFGDTLQGLDIHDAIDRVYETFDDMYHAGRFAEANAIFETFDVSTVPVSVLLSLLTVARWPKLRGDAEKVPAAHGLYQRVRERLIQEGDPEINELLAGLEP